MQYDLQGKITNQKDVDNVLKKKIYQGMPQQSSSVAKQENTRQ